MESGTQYYPSPRRVCTESEYVSLAQIGTLSISGAEPHHLTQLYCHCCSKCFIKTSAYSLRVVNVGCLHFITSCMLLRNTCEIMKKQTFLLYGLVLTNTVVIKLPQQLQV